jgi:hypothetical protein
MHTFWACSKQWRTDVLRWREGCIALWTILAFLTLLAVSGPHLVHHLTELHPQEHHHTQDGHHPPAEHAPPRPDCLVLFLMQHTPVTEAGGALLPILLFAAEPLISTLLLRQADAPKYAVQARAPPPMFL